MKGFAMKQWIIDRFEGEYAVCEGEGEESLLIERAKLPKGAEAGSVLRVMKNGSLLLDIDETRRRREKIREKLRQLLKEE